LNRREQRNIHFQYILLKFKVPWQPSPLEFWVLYCHEIQADASNNKSAFIPAVGMVLLHQIMVPAVYCFFSYRNVWQGMIPIHCTQHTTQPWHYPAFSKVSLNVETLGGTIILVVGCMAMSISWSW
jgi:hypothetical protein